MSPRPVILASVLAFLLAACTTGRGSSDQASPEPEDTTVSSPTSIGDAGGYVFDAGDVAGAYPAPEDPPYDHFSLEHMEWLSFCLAEFGFATTVVNQPGQRPTLHASDFDQALRDRWMQVNEMCTDEAVNRGWVQPIPTTPDQLREEYRRLLAVNDCLAALGYGTDAPSEERYLEERDWNVYANTPTGAQLVVAPIAGADLPANVRQQLEIQQACPIWMPSG